MSLRFLANRVGRGICQPKSVWTSPPLGTSSSWGSSSISLRTFASKKHKNLLKHAKGFKGRAKNCFRVAIRRTQKSWQYAYRDRRAKRRNWHSLWIQRIQAGVRQYDNLSYSRFTNAWRKSPVRLDRKILADLAANEPFSFRSVVQVIMANNNTTKTTQQIKA